MAATDETVRDAGSARAALGMLVERARRLEERNAQLQTALTSRIVIEQAKGVLAERFALSVDAAFDVLRRSARHHRRNLHDLAADVVASRQTPLEVQASLAAYRATERYDA